MMHENIPASRTLDEAITLRVVEPLNFPNFFFHGNLAPSVFEFDSVVLLGGPASQGCRGTWGSAAVAFELRPYDHITNRLGAVYYFRTKACVNDNFRFFDFAVLEVNLYCKTIKRKSGDRHQIACQTTTSFGLSASQFGACHRISCGTN